MKIQKTIRAGILFKKAIINFKKYRKNKERQKNNVEKIQNWQKNYGRFFQSAEYFFKKIFCRLQMNKLTALTGIAKRPQMTAGKSIIQISRMPKPKSLAQLKIKK